MMRILAITKADFLQRVQAPKFGLILFFLAFFTFLLFPGADAKYAVINVYGYRGMYNSAWIGDTLAVINGLMIPLFSFYFIKTAISLDRTTQTDSLLKASGVPNYAYILGKWLSNLALLAVFVLLMNFVAVIKQLYLGESYTVDLLQQFNSQIYISFPALMLTASFALFFESIPGLRSGFGNLIYMYVWMPIVIVSVELQMGVGHVMQQMQEAAKALEPLSSSLNIGGSLLEEPLTAFPWAGADLNSVNITQYSLYLTAASLVLVFITWVLFAHKRVGFKVSNPFKRFKKEKPLAPARSVPASLPSLDVSKSDLSVMQLFIGEFRFIIRARSWFWYLGVAAFLIFPFTIPKENILHFLIPAAGLWAVFAHSELGCRDTIHNTSSLMQSTVFGQSQRELASYAAAVLLQLMVFSGIIVKFIMTGEFTSVLALIVGALFIPSLALFLGKLSGTKRAFEFIFMMIWYAGSVDKVHVLDFLGTNIDIMPPYSGTYLALALILLTVSLLRIKKA